MFQLEHPWLLALLPLPLLIWWLLPPYREESASVRLAFFAEVARATERTPAPGAVVRRTTLVQKLVAPLCWALGVLALARPQLVEPPLEKVLPARDLLLALDLSQSMDERDFRDPAGRRIRRVDAVREVVDGFVERRTDDRIGLIAFGDAPYPLAPFTLDHGTVRALIADAEPGMAGPRTALGDAIGLGIKLFEASKAPEKIMVLLSDGNDTASKMPPRRAAEIARQRGIRVHTVALGDPAAAGEDKVDVATLQDVARRTGGRFFVGQDQRALADAYATLDRITPANEKVLSWRPKRELAYLPVGAATALVIAFLTAMVMRAAIRRVAGGAAAARGPA